MPGHTHFGIGKLKPSASETMRLRFSVPFSMSFNICSTGIFGVDDELVQVNHIGGALVDFCYGVPLLFFVCLQIKTGIDEIGSACGPNVFFCFNGLTLDKPLYLLLRNQNFGLSSNPVTKPLLQKALRWVRLGQPEWRSA
jgi:hypothetical protein